MRMGRRKTGDPVDKAVTRFYANYKQLHARSPLHHFGHAAKPAKTPVFCWSLVAAIAFWPPFVRRNRTPRESTPDVRARPPF